LVVKEERISKKRMDEYADALGIVEFVSRTNKPIETCFKFPWNDTEDAKVMEAFQFCRHSNHREGDRPCGKYNGGLQC
jgi:hypothetical protein